MREKVRDVTELLLSWANAAIEHLQRHDEPKDSRKQPMEGMGMIARSSKATTMSPARAGCRGRRGEAKMREIQLQSHCSRDASWQEECQKTSPAS